MVACFPHTLKYKVNINIFRSNMDYAYSLASAVVVLGTVEAVVVVGTGVVVGPAVVVEESLGGHVFRSGILLLSQFVK